MRIAISNFAWDVHEDASVAKLLGKYDIDAIDIAPGKYFPDPSSAGSEDIAHVRTWWADRGIEITGMQGLLFGTTGLNVFGDAASQQAMLERLRDVCRIGAGLGATRLVFGSARNRDRNGLGDEEAADQAVSFFRRLGDVAESEGVIVCLEPVPARYGSNFMTTAGEAAEVVRTVGHKAIRMQLDIGALAVNRESVVSVLDANAVLVGHIHASEPDFVPLGDGETDHRRAYDALLKYLPDYVVTIEMFATTDEPHLQSIERALACALRFYRPSQGDAG